MRQAVISFLKDKNSRLLLIAGATAVVLGVGIFGGIQLYDGSVEQDRVESKSQARAEALTDMDTLACEAYFSNEHSNLDEKLTMADLEKHRRFAQIFAELGGTRLWLSLLADIDLGYASLFNGGGRQDIVDATVAIKNFCEASEK
jgi:hypothetical protein